MSTNQDQSVGIHLYACKLIEISIMPSHSSLFCLQFPEYRVIPLMTALNGYPKYDPNANTDENEEESSNSDAEEGEEAGQGDRQQEGGEEENVEEEVEQEEELAEETLSTPVE